jgi:hypothetical protein
MPRKTKDALALGSDDTCSLQTFIHKPRAAAITAAKALKKSNNLPSSPIAPPLINNRKREHVTPDSDTLSSPVVTSPISPPVTRKHKHVVCDGEEKEEACTNNEDDNDPLSDNAPRAARNLCSRKPVTRKNPGRLVKRPAPRKPKTTARRTSCAQAQPNYIDDSDDEPDAEAAKHAEDDEESDVSSLSVHNDAGFEDLDPTVVEPQCKSSQITALCRHPRSEIVPGTSVFAVSAPHNTLQYVPYQPSGPVRVPAPKEAKQIKQPPAKESKNSEPKHVNKPPAEAIPQHVDSQKKTRNLVLAPWRFKDVTPYAPVTIRHLLSQPAPPDDPEFISYDTLKLDKADEEYD